MKPIRVVVNDLMQTDYAYLRTEPMGRHYDEGFEPELTPPELLRLGVFGGRYMTDCRDEFPRSWFTHAKLCPERHDAARRGTQSLRRQCIAAARRVAKERLDRARRPARMVPAVLPLLHGTTRL